MKKDNQLEKYKKNPIKKWFTNLLDIIKSKFIYDKLWDKEIEDEINRVFPNDIEQNEVKELLQELLTRNNYLLETLDIKMLDKQYVDLFGKAKLERIITSDRIQKNLLELSKEELQVYNYILNYNLVDFNERIANFYPSSCKGVDLEKLQSLSEKDRLKAISIILSNSEFRLDNLDKLDSYYENRKNICKQIIDNTKIVDKEYEKEMESEDEITFLPFGILDDMKELSDIDRIKYAIIQAKYGMDLEKAEILCSVFGQDIDEIEQSEETRIIKELKAILEEDSIDSLRKINLDENEANYKGTINLLPNLKNAYLRKYKESLYQIKDEDYIGTQSVKTKEKKIDVKIYNALGKNNDRADFNMIVTALGGIYYINHNYDDLKADWNRADKNHTISCSYIGNDMLGVVYDGYLLAFSDIEENELLIMHNKDAGTIDSSFVRIEDIRQNIFLHTQNLKNSTKNYNELLVERKRKKDGILVNRTPTFAVFMAEHIDDINDNKNERWIETKRLAAELGIPVVVIDGTQCTKLEFEKVQEMVKCLKEERRMDLIPDIIHKIENNRAAQMGVLKNTRNEIFSNENINKMLEKIMGAIINSNNETFNQGIEEFAKITKELKKFYEKNSDRNLEVCKTYDYDVYLERLKTLYSSRNGLNGNGFSNTKEKSIDSNVEIRE